MRVLFYADLDISLPGGLETHLRELAGALAARGHQIALFARPVPCPPLSTLATFDPARYDVLHHHAGAWPSRLEAGTRYVRTLHFCVAEKMEAYIRLGRLRTLFHPGNWRGRSEERAALRRPGKLIAVSARVREEFARHYGLDQRRAAVIPNGISPGEPRFGSTAWRARHGVSDEARVLLTIGRRDFVKGYGLLERAWRLAGAGRAGTDLANALWVQVGGSEPLRAPGRLITGPLPHEDVREWIAAADLGALPSYYEGCSVALLEMLAGGLYTLAHDVGDAAQVIRPGANGEVVPPNREAWARALARFLPEPPHPEPPFLPPEYRWDSIAAAVERVYLAD